MISLEAALERVWSELRPCPSTEVALSEAVGRYVAEGIRAPFRLPRFDYSAMDGYLVRSEDLKMASDTSPVSLRLCGTLRAGAGDGGAVRPGECVRIFTGSPLREPGNAVVMQEDVAVDPDGLHIRFTESVAPWENIRMAGEDIRQNDSVIDKGKVVSLCNVPLLASLGIDRVIVGGSPVVGVMATGSELREAGGPPLGTGEIYESNRLMIATGLKRLNVKPKIYPLIPDDLKATRSELEKAFAECDLVVTSGGVSVGEFDFVKEAFESLGGKIDLWKIAIKPGKPFVFGRLGERFLFGLPGNPVSAFVTFLIMVGPAIRRLQGAGSLSLPTQIGHLEMPLSNPGNRRHFMRVHVDDKGGVRSSGLQASHALKGLSCANGLVDFPPGTTMPVGSKIQVIRWGD